MVSVEEVLDRVIVGGCSNHHNVGISVCGLAVKCGGEAKFFLSEIFFNVLVLDGRNTLVDFLHLFRHHVNGSHLMVLRQQGGYAQSHITCSCHCDFQIFKFSHDDR